MQVDSWDGTYRGLIPDAVFDHVTIEARRDQMERFFAAPPDRAAAFVAEHDGGVVGMAIVGPTRDEDLDAGVVGEVRAIYVTPPHWDHGHGGRLMGAALDWLRSEGFAEAMLWVLDRNDRGRSFYERGGWRDDGTAKEDDWFGEVLHEVRYRIDL